MEQPRCIIIAGPNGAGKTTFARQLLPALGIVHFVNADLIAAGLSPIRPDLAALAAGRVFLSELNRLTEARRDFAFETTLSGLTYLKNLRRWKSEGYWIGLHFLQLSSSALAIRRVSARVRQGGHHVPQNDVARRFERGKRNFEEHYRELADEWKIYDNSFAAPRLLQVGP